MFNLCCTQNDTIVMEKNYSLIINAETIVLCNTFSLMHGCVHINKLILLSIVVFGTLLVCISSGDTKYFG